jgi:MFS family permease
MQRAGKPALDGSAAWFTLGMLTFAYALGYVDRQLLALLVDPVKASLRISDTQFSLIQGSAFVLAYLASAPLFGRFVDVAKRRNILVFGVCVWSICTALCATATDFWSLFLFRVGVGLSEGCIFPVAMSMIADSFSPRRTPRAMSVFTLGTQIGGGFSLVAGGLVVAFAGDLTRAIPLFAGLEKWQMALVVVGLPGLLFAASLLLMPEPTRGRGGSEATAQEHVPFGQGMAMFWQRRAFYGRYYGTMCCLGTIQLGFPMWYPAILIRTQHMTMAETGLKMGIISVVVGTVGTLIGPNIAHAFIRRGRVDGPWLVALICVALLGLVCFLIPLVDKTGALLIAGAIVFLTALPLGAIIAAMQNATHSRLRGMAGSFQTFAAQGVGFMISPAITAMITDYIYHDPLMIAHSFRITACLASVIAIWLFATISRPYQSLIGEQLAT